ncbi:MAG: FixH family protein [Novosphingobium sp.]|nr:FixH family protein [Novosphingobium sp.]
MAREFTGKHMLTVMVLGFGVVVGVNLLMARYATSTFGGVVVENSYVASQKFNGWLESAERSSQLGWDIAVEREFDGKVAVSTRNVPAGAKVRAIARHPLGRLPDSELGFVPVSADRFVSTTPIKDGRWIVRLEVAAGPDLWRGERALP